MKSWELVKLALQNQEDKELFLETYKMIFSDSDKGTSMIKSQFMRHKHFDDWKPL